MRRPSVTTELRLLSLEQRVEDLGIEKEILKETVAILTDLLENKLEEIKAKITQDQKIIMLGPVQNLFKRNEN